MNLSGIFAVAGEQQKDEKNKRPQTPPTITFPVPKSEPNLESTYIFPKVTNERAGEDKTDGHNKSVSEIGSFTYAIS